MIGKAVYNIDGKTHVVLARCGNEVLLRGIGWVHVFSVRLI